MSGKTHDRLPGVPRLTRAAFRLGQRLRCGFCHKPPGQVYINARCLEDYSAIYVLLGRGSYRDAEQEAAIGPGAVIQRFPNIPRELRFLENTEMLHFWLGVPRSIYDALVLSGIPDARGAILHVGVRQDLIARAERILFELRAAPDDALFGVLASMHGLIAHFHQLAGRAPARLSPGIEEACALLGGDFGRPVRLSELAAQLNMSHTTFRRLFTRQVGVAPGEYRLRRRTEYVQELLCDMTMTVTEIAERAGYRDLYALSNQFRQRTGMSARQFRAAYCT